MTATNLVTRLDILEVAKTMARDREWPVELALSILYSRLKAQRRFREADLCFEVMQEEMTGIDERGEQEEKRKRERFFIPNLWYCFCLFLSIGCPSVVDFRCYLLHF
jgi:hypothetical protein